MITPDYPHFKKFNLNKGNKPTSFGACSKHPNFPMVSCPACVSEWKPELREGYLPNCNNKISIEYQYDGKTIAYLPSNDVYQNPAIKEPCRCCGGVYFYKK